MRFGRINESSIICGINWLEHVWRYIERSFRFFTISGIYVRVIRLERHKIFENKYIYLHLESDRKVYTFNFFFFLLQEQIIR